LRGIALILAVAIARPCLAAAPTAPAPVSENTVELHLWNIPKKGSTNPLEVARRRVFDAFCLRHPKIRVRALVPLKIEGPAQEGNEFLAVAGGVAPDVFYLFGRKISDYNLQNFFYPLNDYLADYVVRHDKPYSGIAAPDKVWELCHDADRIIAVPYSYYSMALLCEKAAFAKAGLAGRHPKNWQELYEFARKLTFDPSKETGANPNDPVQYGINILTGIYAGWHYLQYVWSAGGDVVKPYYPLDGTMHAVPAPPLDYREFGIRLSNEDSFYPAVEQARDDLTRRGLPADYSITDLKWRLETNKPEAVEAIFFYRKMAHQPWLRNGDHEFDITPEMIQAGKAVDPVTGDVFDLNDEAVQKRIYYGVSAAADVQSGIELGNWRTAMSIGTLGEASNIDPNQTKFVPFPSRKGFPPAAFIAGHYLGINAAIVTANVPGRRDVQAIRDAAWQYIEFLTGPEAERMRIDTFVEYGLAEFIRPALLESAGYGDLLARIPQERRELWDNLNSYARVEPYSKGFTHVMTRELGMVIEAALGDRFDMKTGGYGRDLQAIMDDTCRNVNTMVLGELPDSVVQKRSRIGWVVFAVMAAGLMIGARLIVKLAMQARVKLADTEGFGVGGNPSRRRLYAWLFLTPAVASIAIWAYYPLLWGLLMGFQDYKILGGSTYIGLRNFVEAVSEPKFWRYLLQTLQYMVMLVGIGFCIPIILAVLLTEIPRMKVFFRTVYYLPAVTTGLATLFLWKRLLYDPSHRGVINQLMIWFNSWPVGLVMAVKAAVLVATLLIIVSLFLQSARDYNSPAKRWFFGVCAGAFSVLLAVILIGVLRDGGLGAFTSPFEFEKQSFLRDPNLAMLWVVVPTIWASAGPGCLIYLAALKGIPEEQYEAADLDGAGLWHKLVHVSYPNLKALIIINFIGAVVAGFKESMNIFVMTGGGPEYATMTTGLYIWYNAFMFLNFGLAAAMAWIMGAMLIGFTLWQLRILDKLQFRSAAVEEEMS